MTDPAHDNGASDNPRYVKLRRKFLRRWWAFQRTVYRWRGFGGSMLPVTRRGKYISVLRRGPYIDIVNERENGKGNFIRLVPYQPNHGVMVEKWEGGKMVWRGHADYRQLHTFGFSEVEDVYAR